MRRRVMKLGMACGALVLSAMLCFAGCASGDAEVTATPEPTVEATQTPTPEPTEEATQTMEPSPEPSYVTFGTESADAYNVLLTNGTGQDINALRVRNSDDPEFGENLIPAGTVVVPDETFRLYVPKESAAQESAEASAETTASASDESGIPDVLFNNTYDIALTFADGREATLYDLGLNDIDTALIAYSAEENVAYVSYVSTATQETVSTLDAQIARSRDEAAAALEEANTVQDQVDQSSSVSSGSSSSGSSSSDGESSSGSSESSGGSTSSGSGSSSGGSSSSGGGSASDESSSSGDDESSGGSYEEEIVEVAPEQGIGECIEDNIVWND